MIGRRLTRFELLAALAGLTPAELRDYLRREIAQRARAKAA
jgi:hypothetical protein